MSNQTVIIRRVLPVSREEVFDAWLDPEGMGQWMFPGPVTHCEATLEPKVGGRFHIVMTAPNTKFVHSGEYLVLDRPRKLQFTWISSRMDHLETLVTIELFPHGTECELVLTHEKVPEKHSSQELKGGWNQIFEKLAGYLGER